MAERLAFLKKKGGSGEMVKKTLWTNSSPNSDFAAQTISLDLSKYEGVIIVAKDATTNDLRSEGYIPKDGVAHWLCTPALVNSNRKREVTATNTGVAIGIGINGASLQQAAITIPLEIYGYVCE